MPGMIVAPQPRAVEDGAKVLAARRERLRRRSRLRLCAGRHRSACVRRRRLLAANVSAGRRRRSPADSRRPGAGRIKSSSRHVGGHRHRSEPGRLGLLPQEPRERRRLSLDLYARGRAGLRGDSLSLVLQELGGSDRSGYRTRGGRLECRRPPSRALEGEGSLLRGRAAQR